MLGVAVLLVGGCSGGGTMPDDDGSSGTTSESMGTDSRPSPSSSSTSATTTGSESMTAPATTDTSTGPTSAETGMTDSTTGPNVEPGNYCFYTQGPLNEGDTENAVYLFDNSLKPEQLLASAGAAVNAPTGDKFAYVDGEAVWVFDIFAGEATQVSDVPVGPFSEIRWASDGSALSYVSSAAGDPLRVHAVRADGTGSIEVTDVGVANQLRWSEEGASVAVIEFDPDAGGNRKLVVANLTGGTRVEVDAVPGVDECVDLGFAACGAGFISVIGDCFDPDVFVVDEDGSAMAITDDGLGADDAMACAPDAEVAVFQRGAALWSAPISGTMELEAVTADEGFGGNLQLVSVEGDDGEARGLTFYEPQSEQAVWVAPAAPTTESPSMPMRASPPVLPPDPAWRASLPLVAVASQPEVRRVYVTNPITGEMILVYESTEFFAFALLAYRSTELRGPTALGFSLMFLLTDDGEETRLRATRDDGEPKSKASVLLGDGETQPRNCTDGPYEFLPCVTDTAGQAGVAVASWAYEASGEPVPPSLESATFSGAGPLSIWPCPPAR